MDICNSRPAVGVVVGVSVAAVPGSVDSLKSSGIHNHPCLHPTFLPDLRPHTPHPGSRQPGKASTYVSHEMVWQLPETWAGAGFRTDGIPNEELGAKGPRQPHQGNINPMLLGHSAGGLASRHRCRLMTCLPATPQGVRGNGQPCGGRPVGELQGYMDGAPAQCLTAMGAQVQNPETDPKVCSPWHGVASGTQSWPRFPSPFLTQTSRPAAGAPRRRGKAEGHQQTGGTVFCKGNLLQRAEMLPTGLDAAARRDSGPRPGCAQPRARRSAWSGGRGKGGISAFGALGLAHTTPDGDNSRKSKRTCGAAAPRPA